ncbi:type III restriction protein res subunit [Halosimplex carlsbadense 2-9-1]|uniref:Type III restriction protein res subunit n=1 Tax=Halosimplex carlsbadense 2-9-1 TaxID=797114 RepID=M0CDW0_9EURY|nr:type III restriction protein res subunit [Halosimplex carlsbadense 2-9-1]
MTAPDWVEPRPYQQRAIRAWFEADCSGIFRMATGTGKTVTALQAASQVAASAESGFLLVITVPYQHLVDQWAEEIRDFGGDPVYGYDSRQKWQPRLERELLELNRTARDTTVLVTTHQTLSKQATHQTLARAKVPIMLVGDEVHHLGAPHRQQALLLDADLRLGLSATPDRWYDDAGTEALTEYFCGTVFEYGLEEAIAAGALCEYYYIPHIVELTDEELEVFEQLTTEIGQQWPNSDEGDLNVNLDDHPKLKHLLFERARLIGTAENKLDLLTELLERQSNSQYTLVYCSDGSTGLESNSGRRHVDATTEALRTDCEFSVSRFTAQESRSEREQILNQFEQGDTEILTAIRCLDEGIDVPATRTAYVLASTTNPRQYVQRRGRILRNHPGKEVAVIHDFITVPDADTHPEFLAEGRQRSDQSLIEKELTRALTFAKGARNHPDAEVDGIPTTEGSLQNLKRKYNIVSI